MYDKFLNIQKIFALILCSCFVSKYLAYDKMVPQSGFSLSSITLSI